MRFATGYKHLKVGDYVIGHSGVIILINTVQPSYDPFSGEAYYKLIGDTIDCRFSRLYRNRCVHDTRDIAHLSLWSDREYKSAKEDTNHLLHHAIEILDTTESYTDAIMHLSLLVSNLG